MKEKIFDTVKQIKQMEKDSLLKKSRNYAVGLIAAILIFIWIYIKFINI
jgi:hypothetical protein